MQENVVYRIGQSFNLMDSVEEDLRLSIKECLIDYEKLTIGEYIGKGSFTAGVHLVNNMI